MIRLIYPSMIQQMQNTRQNLSQFLTGYLAAVLVVIGSLAAAHMRTVVLRIMLTLILTLLSGTFLIFLRRASRLFGEMAGVVTKIDEIHGVYEPGAFLPGQSLYPTRWQSFGSKQWKEPVLTACYDLAAFSYVCGLVILWNAPFTQALARWLPT